ncbi:hypothetical protein KEM56_006972 [Ascosphaera pollenicola]|nr:hypothetical protein KEM56_006972 [Ascosphaera pollenicola]
MSIPAPTILIARLAPRTFIGLDLLSFSSTPNFHGVRDISPGAHFLYSGTSESFSLRSGEWIFIGTGDDFAPQHEGQVVLAGQHQGPDIRLRRWDQESETLHPFNGEDATEKQEALRLRANLGQIIQSGGLLSYQDAVQGRRQSERVKDADEASVESADWCALSNYISPSMLTRILGEPLIDSDGRPTWKLLSSGSSALQDAEEIPGLTKAESAEGFGGHDKELGFLHIDLKHTWRAGAIGRERTEAAQDRSWYLWSLIDQIMTTQHGSSGQDGLTFGEQEVLGEMQFTFLMILTLMNFSCLEQWKRILGLIFSCHNAITEKSTFFVKAIRLLALQIQHFDDVEGGLFEIGGDDGGNFLRKLLSSFIRTVDELDAGAAPDVKSEMEKLKQCVEKQLGWELRTEFTVRRGMLQLEDGEQVEMDVSDAEEEDETGEYAPVIVNLEDENFQ